MERETNEQRIVWIFTPFSNWSIWREHSVRFVWKAQHDLWLVFCLCVFFFHIVRFIWFAFLRIQKFLLRFYEFTFHYVVLKTDSVSGLLLSASKVKKYLSIWEKMQVFEPTWIRHAYYITYKSKGWTLETSHFQRSSVMCMVMPILWNLDAVKVPIIIFVATWHSVSMPICFAPVTQQVQYVRNRVCVYVCVIIWNIELSTRETCFAYETLQIIYIGWIWLETHQSS